MPAPDDRAEQRMEQLRQQQEAEMRERMEARQQELRAAIRLQAAPAANAVVEEDSLALVALYNSTDGENWDRNDGWLTAPVADWYGVSVSGDRVVGLSLLDKELSGPIPSEIGQLTGLQGLDLRFNGLTGEIPPALGQLTNLTYLNLNGNELSGSIPPELGQLANLEFLALGAGFFTTEIPDDIFPAFGNDLTGEIPVELAQLASLQTLHLGANQLEGGIPVGLAQLTNLELLNLGRNQLTGSIPSELGQLGNLRRLYLYGNQLMGEIPSELSQLANLQSLWLSGNSLTGEVPVAFTNLDALSFFWFNDTDLCEPPDPDFQSWLNSVENVRSTGVTCEASDGLAITSVEPDPVIGSDAPQPFTINGSGFETGANVTLRDLTYDEVFPNRTVETLTSTEIVINPNFTSEAATWSVEVINPGGESTGPFEFEVVAPSGGGGVLVSEVPLAGSFRMPIGKVGGGSDLGDDLTLLERGQWPASGYPRIRFNDDGDQFADLNEWYVATAHNEDENLTEIFGGNTEPYSESGAYHPGEDWNLTSGTDSDAGEPAISVADGIVVHDACVRNYGRTIIVAHKTGAGKFVTSFYAHLEDTGSFHSVGETVDKGEVLGSIGGTSAADCSVGLGPHLHFEIRRESMLDPEALSNGSVELRYEAGFWPAAGRSDGGQSFIAENYYAPSEFIDEYEGSPPGNEACRANPPVGVNPSYAEISDCIDQLAGEYRVPGLVIRGLLQQESLQWKQFCDEEIREHELCEGHPIGHPIESGDDGRGLTQVTPKETEGDDVVLPLADVEPGQQGRNSFITTVDVNGRASIERLEGDWVYNLEIGIRHLLAKKAAAPRLGTGEPWSDNRILENWYNALAYYNGFTKYDDRFPTPDDYCPQEVGVPIGSKCGNDPGFPYRRTTQVSDGSWTYKKYFPYQEAVFNTIAQQYTIPSRQAKGFPSQGIKVTFPGPSAVSAPEAGGYAFVWNDYAGSFYLDFYVDGQGRGQARRARSCPANRFENCTWLADQRQVAVHRVNSFSDRSAAVVGGVGDGIAVAAGETGTVTLGDSGAEVNITENSDAGGGQLRFAHYDEAPLNSTFGGSAEAPDGSEVQPSQTANRFWDISAVDLTDLSYRVRLSTEGLAYAGDPDRLLVLKRENSSSPWTALSTTREGNTLVSEVLTSFSEFTIGWSAQSVTIPISISRSFGDASESSDYLLVALPGAEEVPLPDVLEGEASAGWQAFRQSESGTGLVPYRDAPESFRFGPGRGFWVIATSDLTRTATAAAVTLRDDGTYALVLHEGWNIISNPFEKPLDWNAVKRASGASQAIHAFAGGSYNQPSTFASATEGEAYYFFNREGLSELVLPYAGGSGSSVRVASRGGASQSSLAPETALWTLALTAERAAPPSEGSSAPSVFHATVRAGAARDAEVGFDPRDQFAPPGRFEALSLGLLPGAQSGEAAGGQDLRGAELAAEYRPPSAGGAAHRFPLVLRSVPDEEVTLRMEGAERLPAGYEALLIREATGERFRPGEAARFTPRAEDERLLLIVGAASSVEETAQEVAPSESKLIGSYPNPFRSEATIAYAVSKPSRVRLTVYDVLGRKVATLVDEEQGAGRRKATLRAGGLASGVYVFRLRIGDHVETGRLVLVR